ncbi:MAG: hypothetical protein ACOYLB_07960 [Phototrophicaceae bacterium]
MQVTDLRNNPFNDPPPVQRWGHILVLVIGLIALLTILNLKNATLSRKTIYTNIEVGITALYPADWLLDEPTNADYVFRVQNRHERGYPTTFQIASIPVSGDSQARSILDLLTLERSKTLAAYRTLLVESYQLTEDQEGIRGLFTYVETSENPFIQAIPSVVSGVDIVVNVGGRALVITFISEASTYDENYILFETFLEDLDF